MHRCDYNEVDCCHAHEADEEHGIDKEVARFLLYRPGQSADCIICYDEECNSKAHAAHKCQYFVGEHDHDIRPEAER